MNKQPAIELKNITKTFGKVIANKNVNLTAYRGEILSILGENGSGKTTLLKLISGEVAGLELTVMEPVFSSAVHSIPSFS